MRGDWIHHGDYSAKLVYTRSQLSLNHQDRWFGYVTVDFLYWVGIATFNFSETAERAHGTDKAKTDQKRQSVQQIFGNDTVFFVFTEMVTQICMLSKSCILSSTN